MPQLVPLKNVLILYKIKASVRAAAAFEAEADEQAGVLGRRGSVRALRALAVDALSLARKFALQTGEDK